MESRKNEFSNIFIASKSLDFYNMTDNVDLNTQQSGNPLTQTKCRSCLLSLVHGYLKTKIHEIFKYKVEDLSGK